MHPVLAVLVWGLADICGQPLLSGGHDGAVVYTTTLTIPTYPYANYLDDVYSPVYNMYYSWLDWDAYNAPGQSPSPQAYTAVVLENDWLRLTVLPELGGRLYGVTVRATGEQLLYQNPVIKPTAWGPPEQGWWLAAGGIEWCLPVEEHGYEWGIPWAYDTSVSGDGATVTLWDSTADDRIRARITIHLPVDQAVFQVSPRLENPTSASTSFKFWINAMLAPGWPNTVGPGLRFVLPIDQVTVHSRGDGFLPGQGEPMDWPLYGGVDYSWLGNWNRWLGVFVRPQAVEDWAGVYDQSSLRGLARVFPRQLVVGVKAFGFGWSQALDPGLWTDDGSMYVELHGGPSPTFWDAITLEPGQVLEWTETWMPIRSLPELTVANEAAALGLRALGQDFHLGLVVASARQDLSARLWNKDECTLLWRQDGLALSPGEPFTQALDRGGLTNDQVVFAVVDGDLVLASTGVPQCPVLSSHVEVLDPVQTTEEFYVSWTGLDVGQGLAGYDVQVREGGPEAAWNLWLSGTTDGGALFSGQDGQTYTFRTQARDIFGALEPLPEGKWADSFTTVLLEPAPVLITSQKRAEPLSARPGESIDFRILLTNTGSLAATVQVTDSLPLVLELAGQPYCSQPPDPVVVSNTILWSGAIDANQTVVEIGFTARLQWVPPGNLVTNAAWIDDGVHLVLYRDVTVGAHLAFHLPLAFRH